jgi:hypothetical protein
VIKLFFSNLVSFLHLNELILFILFCLFIVTGKTQTIEEWLKSKPDVTQVAYCIGRAQQSNLDLKKVSESKKEEYEKNLFEKCIANIALEIKIDKKYLVPTDKYSYFEKKDKELYAVVIINKVELSQKLLKILENDIKETDSKLSSYEGKAFTTSQAAQAKVDEVSRLLQGNIDFKNKLLALNENLIFSVFNDYVQSINAKINDLQTKYNMQAKTEDINLAQSFLVNNQYLEAYKKFLNLNVQYPNVEEILQGKEEAKEKLVLLYDYRIQNFLDQNRLDLAVKTIDTLIALDISFSSEYRQRKKSINEDLFNQIVDKIEIQLKYDQPSSKNLRILINDLAQISFVNEKLYKEYQLKVEKITLDYEIQNVKSLLYKNRYDEALRTVNELKKQTLTYDNRIDKLENKLEDKISDKFKKELLKYRCRRFSFEPTITFMLPEQNAQNFSQIKHVNLNLMYSGGLYYRFNIQPKPGGVNFKFSQFGVKFDYLDNRQRIFKNDSINNYINQESYSNPQISLNLRKCIQFDLGYLTNANNILNFNDVKFTGAFSFYLPFYYFSMGITSKYITDFKGVNTISIGYGIKINLGFSKKYTSDDKKEIETRMMQVKNQ